MKSLFDLLDVLPDDDADRLRAAFREASEANRSADGKSVQEKTEIYRRLFREYAHLVENRERNNPGQRLAVRPKPRTKSNARRLTGDFLAITAWTVVFVGAAILSESFVMRSFVENVIFKTFSSADRPTGLPKESPVASGAIEPSRESGEIRSETLAGTQREETAPPAEVAPNVEPTPPPATAPMAEPTQKAAAASTGQPDDISSSGSGSTAALETAPKVNDADLDARHYRERGVRAYKAGNIYVALACFEIAIEKDPNFSDAYIDRAIVHYRMGNFARAFADVARAKRIDESRREEKAESR